MTGPYLPASSFSYDRSARASKGASQGMDDSVYGDMSAIYRPVDTSAAVTMQYRPVATEVGRESLRRTASSLTGFAIAKAPRLAENHC